MKSEEGFTLIELLVVVLIIGVLAAIALPQYQKAVEKTRAAQAFALIKPIEQAMVAYRMQNGGMPSNFGDLPVDMKGWPGREKFINRTPQIKDTRSNGEWSVQLYEDTGGNVQLYLGRISGKYKGAGFQRQILMVNGDYVGNTRCVEVKQEGIIFSGDVGDYCTKIFKGKQELPEVATSLGRWFIIP